MKRRKSLSIAISKYIWPYWHSEYVMQPLELHTSHGLVTNVNGACCTLSIRPQTIFGLVMFTSIKPTTLRTYDSAPHGACWLAWLLHDSVAVMTIYPVLS